MNHDQHASELSLEIKAETALKHAVGKVIEVHRRTGEPLVVWQDGRIVLLAPDQAVSPHVALQEATDVARHPPSPPTPKRGVG